MTQALDQVTHRRVFLGILEWAALIAVLALFIAWLIVSWADIDWDGVTATALKLAISFFFLTAGMRFAIAIVDRLRSSRRTSNG